MQAEQAAGVTTAAPSAAPVNYVVAQPAYVALVPFISEDFSAFRIQSGYQDPRIVRLCRIVIQVAMAGFLLELLYQIAVIFLIINLQPRTPTSLIVSNFLINMGVAAILMYCGIIGVKRRNPPCCCGCGHLQWFRGWNMFNATMHFLYFLMRVLYLARGGAQEDDELTDDTSSSITWDSSSGNWTQVEVEEEVERIDETVTSILGIALNFIFGVMSFVCMFYSSELLQLLNTTPGMLYGEVGEYSRRNVELANSRGAAGAVHHMYNNAPMVAASVTPYTVAMGTPTPASAAAAE
eukprot:CAMPEP_0119470456 /NCGR_PEP_ID=MMETSP1344-20130328/3349_1 /TAXON_ID=236787 /ORGANISM="Florenciella parvula, Strain CCMP2471" /LENGTH=293 /DNA_ID=CAMNT_0007503139 /DNA_START=377 /DNA_END=1255 /DNA_ORIENTATION=+